MRTLLTVIGIVISNSVFGASASNCEATFPERVKWIVPNTPGSLYDIYSRMLEPYLEAALGTRIVIDNISGAGGRIGAASIANAKSSNDVFGIVNGVSLLANELVGEAESLPTLGSFRVLYRMSRVKHVWVTATHGALKTMPNIREMSKDRPIVVATRDVSSSSFHSLTLGAHLLGLPIEVVAGYASNRESRLALLRGEADIASANFESVVNMLESGELTAVLQISSSPIAQHPSLTDVPVIAGANGLVAMSSTNDYSQSAALLLTRFLGAGQLVVGPRNLNESVASCVEQAVHNIVSNSSFREDLRNIGLSIDPAPGSAIRRELEQVLEESDVLSYAISEQLEQLRR
ncbi:MAG: tripartite tricarboxylate transporter substrate-binding protein [Gammaproteobacteria bacterium]|nr:tripartite tricarboxylate transporter substrate-binding protein [Gammaproteobacteria bacterium]